MDLPQANSHARGFFLVDAASETKCNESVELAMCSWPQGRLEGWCIGVGSGHFICFVRTFAAMQILRTVTIAFPAAALACIFQAQAGFVSPTANQP
jgi:hypothetical protein